MSLQIVASDRMETPISYAATGSRSLASAPAASFRALWPGARQPCSHGHRDCQRQFSERWLRVGRHRDSSGSTPFADSSLDRRDASATFIMELRTRIDAVQVRYGLTGHAWTDAPLSPA